MKAILDLYGFRKEIEVERLERIIRVRTIVPPQTIAMSGIVKLAYKDLCFVHDKRVSGEKVFYKYCSGLD